jgi:hypothetical protein
MIPPKILIKQPYFFLQAVKRKLTVLKLGGQFELGLYTY